ncbi:MAG: hypothetical protein FWG73_01665 [Planctomycetaceae bacterium]|nr:hypothetical protein [Planctomycetaceae bacterium]
MPTSEAGKTIEKMYWDHVRAMSPAERIRGCFRMFQSFYSQAAIRYQKEHHGIGERELRIAMAKRLYGGDPRTRILIEMAEAEQRTKTDEH